MDDAGSQQIIKQQLLTLLESAPNYMREISTFSQKICRSQTRLAMLSVNLVRSILDDYSAPPKKKLFALRFIKDTLILSSHCFYMFCVAKILPWMIQIFKEGDKAKDNGLSFLVEKISKTPTDSQVQTISKSILQLMGQILKWTGTNIKLHPYYKIKHSSAFKLYLDCFDKVKTLKVTQLTFYKIQDLQRYENQYLQEELNIQEWFQTQTQFIDLLLTNSICLPFDDSQKQLSKNLLQTFVQIGDSLWIRKILQLMKPLIQSPITGYQSILLLHDLMKVRQIQFCIGIRNQLLEVIGYYLLMMSKQNYSKTQNINLLDLCRYIFVWKLVTQSLGAQTKSYDELFLKLKQEWVVTNQQEYQDNFEQVNFVYKPILKITDVNNKEKMNNFNIRQSTKIWDGIKKLKYIKIHGDQQQRDKENQLMEELQKQVQQIKMKNLSKLSSKIRKQQKDVQKIGGGLSSKFLKSPIQKQMQLLSLKQISQKNRKPPSQKKSDIITQNYLNNSKSSNMLIQNQSPIKLIKGQDKNKRLIQNYSKNQIHSHNLHNKTDNQNEEQFIQFDNSVQRERQQPSLAQKSNIYTNRPQKNRAYEQNSVKSSEKSSKSRAKNSKFINKIDKIQKASSLSISLKRIKSSDFGSAQLKSSQILQNKPHKQILNILKFQNSHQNSRDVQDQQNANNFEVSRNNYDNQPFKQSKVIYFDQNYYSRTKNNQNNVRLKTYEKIKVLQTVKKPKFGFSKENESIFSENSFRTDQQNHQNVQNVHKSLKLNFDKNQLSQKNRKQRQLESQLINESINPTIVDQDRLSNYSSVPSNFNDVLKVKKKQQKNSKYELSNISSDHQAKRIKFNKFPHKIKQLEAQIQRTKRQQQKIQQLMREKDDLADQLKRSMPNDNKFYVQENQRLKKQLISKSSPKNAQSKRKQKDIKLNLSNLIHQPITRIYPVYSKPLPNTFKKMVISNKCLVEKNNMFELGYAYKADQKMICLYLKFLVEMNQVWIRVWNNSLKLKQDFKTNLYNVLPNQQFKFTLNTIGFILFDEEFQPPIFQIHPKLNNNKITKILKKLQNDGASSQKLVLERKNYNYKIPCNLFTFLIFRTPKIISSIKFIYATDWHECNQQFIQFQQAYLMNIFKNGYYQKRSSSNSDVGGQDNTKIQDGFLVEVKDCFKNAQYLNKDRILRIKKQKSKFYIQSNNNYQDDKYILKGLLSILEKNQN